MLSKSDERMGIEKRTHFEAEAARQFALDRYDVLDTAAEDCFDQITQAIISALEVPCAAISFLDGERQWFKSKIGLAISEIPRAISFCNYTIAQNSPMIIEDVLQDVRFGEHPAISGSPFVRSYIGMPLTTPDGHNIGTISAMDIVPRPFRRPKIDWLERLAELVIHELELRQQAEKDRLTGALTRSGFSVEVQKAISLFDRQEIKSTLVLFDVDLYKMVKHRFGRPSGNAMLKSVIEPLVMRLKPANCIGRIGGTQFAVLLTDTSQAKAIEEAAAIRRKLEMTNSGIFFDVGFSEISSEIGICEDWLDHASSSLRASKKIRENETKPDFLRHYNLAG
jgi:diguanylate cyclase (GGDEF)-like protein